MILEVPSPQITLELSYRRRSIDHERRVPGHHTVHRETFASSLIPNGCLSVRLKPFQHGEDGDEATVTRFNPETAIFVGEVHDDIAGMHTRDKFVDPTESAN